MEKWEDKRDFIFPHLCLVGEVDKCRDRKLFCLVKKKNERMENIIYINLQPFHY